MWMKGQKNVEIRIKGAGNVQLIEGECSPNLQTLMTSSTMFYKSKPNTKRQIKRYQCKNCCQRRVSTITNHHLH